MILCQKIQVLGISVKLSFLDKEDYVSLTDIARYKNPLEPKDVVGNWLRLKNTIEYLGLWEKLNNPDFKGVEFDPFRNEAGSNAFTLSPKRRIEHTNAIGLFSRSGNTGGTFAHKDIAIKFANWISVEFELYLIKEFQRLKNQETKSIDWNMKRMISKMNYKIHTDAIKHHLIPHPLSYEEINFIYADEADVLNKALWGMTAKERKDKYPNKKGNMRDDATFQQLIVLANMESMNAECIKRKMKQSERLELLNIMAIDQMKSLLDVKNVTLASKIKN